MDQAKTDQQTNCAGCGWYIYKGQVCPVRIKEELQEDVIIKTKDYYCSSSCYENPEEKHVDQAVS